MDFEAVQVADDEQRRVFQGLAVLQQLLVGGDEILVLPFVFQPKWPRIQTSAQPSPPAVFLTPLFKAVPLSLQVHVRRRGLGEQLAQVEKMLLAGGPLRKVDGLPLGDELGGGHGGCGGTEFRRARGLRQV